MTGSIPASVTRGDWGKERAPGRALSDLPLAGLMDTGQLSWDSRSSNAKSSNSGFRDLSTLETKAEAPLPIPNIEAYPPLSNTGAWQSRLAVCQRQCTPQRL